MATASITQPLTSTASSARTSGLLMAVASALAFSSSGPFIKPLLEGGWSLGAALIVRTAVSGIILAPALILALRRNPAAVRQNAWLIIGFGLTAVAGCQLFFFSAMQRMPVAVALLIQYLAPVLLVILAWIRTRRTPSRLVLGGSVVAVVGLVCVVDIAGAQFDLIGTLLALAAAVCVGAYFLIAERTGDRIDPLALASGGLLTAAVVFALLLVTGLMPFAAPDITVTLAGMDLPWWIPLLWVAAVATTIGYALGVLAIPRIGSRVASFVGLSEVLFALGIAWLFLGETPAPIQFFGGALILVGVVLVRLDANSAGEPKGEAAIAPIVPAP